MANQQSKHLDVDKSYVPVDPNAFPDNYVVVTKEDSPYPSKPIVAYEGYNFLPTSYGYKSYFGVTSKLDIDAIPARVDDVFIIQTNTFQNIAVALCEDGIWVKDAGSTGAWFHSIILTVPAVGEHLNWTYCTIANKIYCYRATGNSYFVFSSNPEPVSPGEIEGALPAILDPLTVHAANEFFAVKPNFLNMAGQQGIFKAGISLGFWDSANSIGTSNIDDLADFKPSVTTLAANSIFVEVIGRIVNILAMEDGFIIYSTKSIVSILKGSESTFLWLPKPLMQNGGISFIKEACVGEDTNTQYAYTNIGLVSVSPSKITVLTPEVTDFLKESKLPVYPKMIEGRYLFLEILDNTYIDGLVSFTTETIPATTISYPPGNIATNPDSTGKVESIFNGDNSDILALIDAWIAQNNLPLRKTGTNYTTVFNGTLLDKTEYKPLDYPTYPTFAPTLFDMSELEAGLLVNPASPLASPSSVVVDALYASIDATPFVSDAYILTNIALNTVDVGGGMFDCYHTYSYIAMTPVLEAGIDNFRAFTAPELATGLSGVMELQRTKWATNDALMQELTNFVYALEMASTNVTTDKGYYTSNGSNPASHFTLVNNNTHSPRPDFIGAEEAIIVNVYPGNSSTSSSIRADVYVNFHAPCMLAPPGESTTTDDYDVERAILTNAGIYDCNQVWETPTVSITNNLVTFKRVLDRHTRIYARVRVKSSVHEIFAQQGSLEAKTMSTSTKNTDLGIYESTTLTITGYQYIDINDVVRTVPWGLFFKYDVDEFYWEWGTGTITLPPSSFLLQEGSVGPIYPTIPGALVFDTGLKKWGKMKQDYRVLVDWSPLNNQSGDTIPYETFGMQGGIVQIDGKISLFDMYPVDSYMKYGKIGYYRQGMTSAEEVRVNFRTASKCTIRVESSLDGYSVEAGLTKEYVMPVTEMGVVMFPSTTARWHTVSVIGTYDIRNMEYRGTLVGNR